MFVVFDLDDTLADTSHREHILTEKCKKETGISESEVWNKFFDACDKDEPKIEIITILDELVKSKEHRIEIWTGRSDRVRIKTVAWLHKHLLFRSVFAVVLRMREEGDYRHDKEIKSEWIEKHGKPDLVFDDRNSTVKWWREQGITCCQVKESNY